MTPLFAQATTATVIVPAPQHAPPMPPTDPSVVVSLVGAVVALGALIGWLVRSGRAESRQCRADIREAFAAAAREREAEAERRVQQAAEQNKVLGLMSSKLAKIGTALHELTIAHHENNERFADVVDRLRHLEERTDDHRPLKQ